MKAAYGIVTSERYAEFVRNGYSARHFFPHVVRYLPKCGPDAFKIARRMLGDVGPDQVWEIVIHAAPSLVSQFPSDLFFDDDIIWHQQQLGLPGHVATANLVVRDNELFTMVHISDLVQRISRRRGLKTRIENRFKGWNHMLLNGILNFARHLRLERINVADSRWAMIHTDPARNVGPEMFERVYDRNVVDLFDAGGTSPWHSIDVARNLSRLVTPEPGEDDMPDEKTICVCHDVEGGLGHIEADPEFSRRAEATASAHLEQMIAIERQLGVTATYAVVGSMLTGVRQMIEQDGHSIAFHSWDHTMSSDQLGRCRSLDYRIKGYRAPQSVITPELADENLCAHNFEWLGNSAYSFGFKEPRIEGRIAKLPIHFDDFAMYHDGQSYEDWEARALEIIDRSSFVAFGLHDCYGEYWLPQYSSFLEKVSRRGRLVTMNGAADELFLQNALPLAEAPGEASL